jgi:hypothetical protein
MKGVEMVYLQEYINSKKLFLVKNEVNLIKAQCGCGKTHWAMDCILNEHSPYYSPRNLYVTDTSALKQSVQQSYFKETGKRASQYNENMNVITYQHLANIIQEKLLAQESLTQYFNQYDTVFFDEVHQLFIYANKFDECKKGTDLAEYELIIKNILAITNSTTLVCLSATPNPLYRHFMELGCIELIHDVLPIGASSELNSYTTRIRHETMDLYDVAYNIQLNNAKLFIFANTINELKKYENILRKRGYTTLALWNHKKYQNEQDKHLMTEYQLQAREKLLTTGEFDEQVLLLNGAYESGINIEYDTNSSKQTIYIIVASSDEIKITQARGRIRHNIDTIYTLMNIEQTDYTQWQGIENNQELCDRLDNLVDECELNELSFEGKQGLNTMAEYLRITTRNKYGQLIVCTSMKAINNELMLRDLPYKIDKVTIEKRTQGKRTKLNYYTIIAIE